MRTPEPLLLLTSNFIPKWDLLAWEGRYHYCSISPAVGLALSLLMRHRDKKVKLPSDHLSLMCNYRARSCLWIWIWWLCWHLMALVPSRMLFFLTQISCFVLCWCFIAVELWIYLWITYLRNPCIDANFYIKLWMVCRKIIGVSMQPLLLVSLPRRYCGLLGGTGEEFVCFFVVKLWKKKGFLFTPAREVST